MPNAVADNSTADVAASHYYLYKQDFARLKNLGIPAFSFSISWPRIFPFGHGPINQAGVKHYDDVFAELVKNGIQAAPVLFHWETPWRCLMSMVPGATSRLLMISSTMRPSSFSGMISMWITGFLYKSNSAFLQPGFSRFAST